MKTKTMTIKGSEHIGIVLARFTARKNTSDATNGKGTSEYHPTERERNQVQQLLDEGYSVEQLTAAIDQAFDSRPPDAIPVRSFGFVLSYVHRRLRPAGQPSTEADLTGDTRGQSTSAATGDRLTGMATTGVPSAADAERTPQPADDPMAPVYALLEAASIRDMEGVGDVVYDIPGIRLGLRHLLEMPEPFSPDEIHGAVLAAVSRHIVPERLVGYVEAVLENGRSEAREQERAKARVEHPCQSAAEIRLRGLPSMESLSDEDIPESEDVIADSTLDPRALWETASQELEMQMTKATFNTWLKPTRLLAWEPADQDHEPGRARAIIGVPNEYVRDWLENRLCTPIVRTLSGIAGQKVSVEFRVTDQADLERELQQVSG